ncbi:MAG: PKD domain-containing protein, partial [Planctomycetes bacterium]|nr:PKD domain-containing protein [Planctomycetota bacterium]
WDFGDGRRSTRRHPIHTYTEAGDHTVTLYVSGAGGSDNNTKADYIMVTEPPSPSATTTIKIPWTTTTPEPTTTSTAVDAGANTNNSEDGGNNPSTSTTSIVVSTTSTAVPTPAPECHVDRDCDDGTFCNGEELCSDGICLGGDDPCSFDETCMDDVDECWGFEKLNVMSLQKQIRRPIIRDHRCLWLVLKTNGQHNFDNGESTIRMHGSENGYHGVGANAAKEAFGFLDFILLPICINKYATSGKWSVIIETKYGASDSPFVEVIESTVTVQ